MPTLWQSMNSVKVRLTDSIARHAKLLYHYILNMKQLDSTFEKISPLLRTFGKTDEGSSV